MPTSPDPVGSSLSRRSLVAGSATALGLGALGTYGIAASQATPVATSAADLLASPAAGLLRLIQFDRILPSFGAMPTEEQVAALYAMDVAPYRAVRAGFDANALQAAVDLLADPAFADQLGRLPFQPGDTIVGLGDSITADLHGWVPILRHVLALRWPHGGMTVVGEGITNDTSTDLIARFDTALVSGPTWLITMVGTNDASRYGAGAGKTQVGIDEYTRNIAEIVARAAAAGVPNLAWISPPPCDEATVSATFASVGIALTIQNADLAACGDALRATGQPVADLAPVFGDPVAAGLLMEDGLHPSLSGHRAIVRTLVAALAS